jgi:hypothetical protein
MSETAVDDALVAQLARSAVSEAAPEELPLFRATSKAYFEDPDALRKQGSGDQMLGFGVEAAVVLVTPVALDVARDVLNFVLAQVREQAREHGKEAIERFTDRLLDHVSGGKEKEAETAAPAGAGAATPELTDEQLEQVRALALEKAAQLRLAPDKAELLADSLVGSLATA